MILVLDIGTVLYVTLLKGNSMRVLVGCEESQAVTIEFRRLGHEAYSCDILPCSGGHPEWHIQDDVLEHLNEGWDLGIFHPPCPRLTNTAVRWLHERNLWDELDEAAAFFRKFVDADIPKKAIENPIPHKYAVERIGRKYDQLVQPYMFGHLESKATCLWLYDLPRLQETDNVKDLMKTLPKKLTQRNHYLSPGPDRAKLRSKTYPGIAKAMATQWSC